MSERHQDNEGSGAVPERGANCAGALAAAAALVIAVVLAYNPGG